MGLNSSRIIVVDDKEDEGLKITRMLWKAGLSARFIVYNEKDFIENGIQQSEGVRVVFMDVILIEANIPEDGPKIFSAVQGLLQKLISSENGPYVLITWSSYDKQAEALFSYLQERMPANQQPTNYKRLNKEEFMGEKPSDLFAEVQNCIKDLGVISCLVEWESGVQTAVSGTIQSLGDIALELTRNTRDDAMKQILWTLAKAEAGKTLNENNAVIHLYTILSSLLSDRIMNAGFPKGNMCEQLDGSDECEKSGNAWHRGINTMLHLDFPSAPGLSPGNSYGYPESRYDLLDPKLKEDKFLRGHFMCYLNDWSKAEKKELACACQLLLTDITPPCDHAQDKTAWRKYVVATKIPIEYLSSCYIYNKELKQRNIGHLCGDYLWMTPEFEKEEDGLFAIVFNARFIISLPKAELKDQQPLFRIRQPLLSDMIGWLTRQSSRLGHIALSI